MSETTENPVAEETVAETPKTPKTPKAPKLYPSYVTDKPSDLQARFATWILEKTGFVPTDDTSFREGVRLGVALRMSFQRSDENRTATAEVREALATARANRGSNGEVRAAKAAERAAERAAKAQARAEELAVAAEAKAQALRDRANGVVPAVAPVKAAKSAGKGKTAPVVADEAADSDGNPW